MANTGYVLIYDSETNRLKTEQVNDNSIPQLLNGESGFHVFHVRKLTELILREYVEQSGTDEITEEDIEAVAIASSLHDIGKSQIPKSILDYPGTLSPVEYDIVKKHAAFGQAIIENADKGDVSPKIVQYAAEIARWHHERVDGTGYPDGLSGERIPIAAQVVALADSYDALTSPRSYKREFSQDVAMQMIVSGMCGVFSEILLDCLTKVINHRSLLMLRKQLEKQGSVVSTESAVRAKRILCIGNTEYLDEEFIENTFPESKVTVIGKTDLSGAGRIKLFRVKKPSVKAVFETYSFDIVIYFSNALTFNTTEKSDAEELREVLYYAHETQPDAKILYLSSLDTAFRGKTDKAVLFAVNENLCEYYAKHFSMDIKVVQIPYLYSGTYAGDFLYKIFDRIRRGKKVDIPEAAETKLHFLSLYDLSVLLERLLDNWKKGGGVLAVGDEFSITFGDFAKRLTSVTGHAKVDFVDTSATGEIGAQNKTLRTEYGWFAKISVLDDLHDQYAAYLEQLGEKEMSLLDRIRKWMTEHAPILKTIELFLLFFLFEGLMYLTDSAVIFSIVDFRTIYIVIMATVHGLYFGIGAAALSSLSWLVAKIASGMNAMTIFYEPTNWLAFVFFFLVGALCGYTKLKKDDRIRSVTEQNQLLENKLVFTRDLYEDTFREKRDLKKQIISSKDSFGKIFDITRRLNTVEPQLLYLSIMDTFEEVLENNSITVYSINENSAFGRLEVASRNIIDSASRSICTDNYSEIFKTLSEGEIWRNTDLRQDLPMYAAGVYRAGKPLLLILLWHADADQRSLYYVNLFKILRDLVQMSMLRAYDYNQAVYATQYIEGTHIMTESAFAASLENFKALAERKVSTFVLLEADLGEHTYAEADEILARKVRANDIIGAAGEGKLLLLMSQATENDLSFILPRFEGLDIQVSVRS